MYSVIVANLERKHRVIVLKASVSHARKQINKMVRRREVVRFRSVEFVLQRASRSGCDATVDEKKKR